MAVSLLAAGAATAATATAATAPAKAGEASLRLAVASDSVTVDRYKGQKRVMLDLGTHLATGDSPFEVRLKRDSYNDPIVATQILHNGAQTETKTLPAGLVKDFTGFPGFFHLTLTNARGKKIVDRDQLVCPAGEGSRIRPDAPARSPYPPFCPWNPFTLGAVWGVQQGWAVDAGLDERPLQIPDGKYTATIGITKKYQDALGADGTVHTIKVTVRTVKSDRTANAARRHAHGVAARPASARPTGAPSVPDGPKPDLRALPAYEIHVMHTPNGGQGGVPPVVTAAAPPKKKKDYLTFNATVWNAGPSPLVVDGFRRSGENLMDAYQYFYDEKGEQVGYAPTGAMEWDPRDGHQHWHFRDFASYRLLDSEKKTIVRSQKEAFCLANTDAVDFLVPNANWNPGDTDLHTACGDQGSLSVREVLDVGSGDTYAQYLPGQSFDVTNLPNGTYYIQVIANPSKRLYESATDNNVSLRKIVISGRKGARKVAAADVGLIKTP